MENAIRRIAEQLPDDVPGNKRWAALQFLEGNERMAAYLHNSMNLSPLAAIRAETERALGGALAKHIYEARDRWIAEVIAASAIEFKHKPLTWTEKSMRW